MTAPNRLVWIDLEMTGLDPTRHVILEIATIITDNDLHTIAEGPNLYIRHSPEVMEQMDPWSATHHERSGLLESVKRKGIPAEVAARRTMEFLREHLRKNSAPLCGNSVWQDRRFLSTQMPDIDTFLHYRIIDVSSIKELVKRWSNPTILPPRKKNLHRALEDIRESIGELRFYRENIFNL
jgi:oligoribonuclease